MDQQEKLTKKYKNWASDKEFSKKVLADLMGIFNVCKSDRKVQEDIWHEVYDMWAVTDNQQKGYNGRANLYWPQIRKEIETMTRRLDKALFPDDYLSAIPGNFEDEKGAESAKFIVRHFLDNVIKIKSLSEPWIKQGVMFGTSPLKSYWCSKSIEQFYKKKFFEKQKDGTFEPNSRIVKEDVRVYHGPKLKVCDIFNTWVYPQTAITADDIEGNFERYNISLTELKYKEKIGAATNLKDVKPLGQKKKPADQETQRRFADQGSSGQLVSTEDMFEMIEVWCELDLPDGKRLPCIVEIINQSVVTRIQQNPLWTQKSPYRYMRFIKAPGNEFYGRGLPEAGRLMQYQLNDTINQTVDSNTLSLNNITIIDPAYAPNADSFEIEPGARWWANPNGVKQMVFPDLTKVGMDAAQMVRQGITEMSDNSPQLPDPIAGKARSTGQATLAFNEWQTDLWHFMKKIENEALEPTASDIYMLLQQYVDEDVIVRVSGKYAGTWERLVVTPEEICGHYLFQWQGAIQTENNSVKTQQVLQLMKVLTGVPPEADVKINWPNLVAKILTDGFQYKDPGTIVETKDMTPTVAPGIENKIILLGGTVTVKPSDNDELHLASHIQAMNKEKDPYKKHLFNLHNAYHEAQLKQKQQAQAMQQQAAMMAMQQAQGQQGKQQPQGPPNPMGNQGQINESVNVADMGKGMRL